MRVAVLGLGEAGAALARDLADAGVAVSGYDPAGVPTPRGVQRHGEPAAAVAGADLVLALTAGHQALAALEGVAGALPAGSIYADLSTGSPGLKGELATRAARREVGFVDVALMAPVPGRGLRTPALASGDAAQDFAGTMRGLGMPVEAVGDRPGEAATRKLLRSVVMKGLAQLLLESLDGAAAAGLAAGTWDHLVAQLTSIDEALLRRLVDGTRQHAARRLDEMEAVVAMLDELGVDATMSRATVERLRDLAASDRPSGGPAG